MNTQPNREESIFQAAFQLPNNDARAAYLDEVCGEDLQLRRRVEARLQVHQEASSFLNQSAAGPRATPPAAAPNSLNAPKSPDAPTVVSTAADEAVRAPSEKPGDRIGHYKLLEQLGEGGMGVVYLAEQEQPVWRKVALKIIKLGMDTKSVIARFEAERQALALMDHPNIAKVFEAGATETGRPFFVMELVRGVPITEYCDKNHLSARERLGLFLPVCQAIQHAHQKGIIHRDIKPSNVMVTLLDGRPVPMVIDFGIAKATHQKLTEKTLFTNLGQMIGTPAYMSPEQAELSKMDVDTRSDIYSLGVLLYELLTGTTPFPEKRLRSAGFGEMQRIIAEEEPERPSTRLSTMENDERTTVARNRSMEVSVLGRLLRGDLDWIAMKCLEKDRTRRYETVNGLEADIQRHLSNEPINARPPSAAYRFQKLVRRNKVAFAGAAAVAAALLFGTIGMTTLYFRSERLRHQSQQNLYVANMNLAQQAWEQNNVGQVRQLLEETAAYPDRGFEWYYWQRQTHLELMTLRGNLGLVYAVAFSPDGRRIFTASRGNTAKEIAKGETVKVWEASSGKELLSLKGHRISMSVAFSPDGLRIVTSGWGDPAAGLGTVKVWEVSSGKELLTLKGNGVPVNSVAFSPDGLRIVTTGADFPTDRSVHSTAKVWVWEATTGTELLTLEGHSNKISSVTFSPDGQRIVTGSWDQTVKVWEAASGEELLTLKGHNGRINTVAISPDGRRIVTGSDDQSAKVWEAASGNELLTLKGHNGRIYAVAFSPDGQRIVTGSDDQTAKVWEAASGNELLTLKGHSAKITSVTFSPDSRRIVTGSWDQTAKVWETAIEKELLTLKGNNVDSGRVAQVRSMTAEELIAFSFSPQGLSVEGGIDGPIRVRNEASGKELELKGHMGVFCWAFSPDGRRIVTGSVDQTAKVWKIAFPGIFTAATTGRIAASGKEILTLKGHSAGIMSVAFSPDGRRIVTGSDSGDQTAKVWDAASGKELLTLNGHGSPITSVAFSSDGQRIVTGSRDKTTKVWEAASPEQVAAWQKEEQAAARR